MSVIEINGSAFVMLVQDLEKTVQFYSELGFGYEVVGSKVKHHHVGRNKLILILVEANQPDEVTPISSRYEEQYFDVYGYTNAVDLLYQECVEKNVTIVRQPHYSAHWSEFTFRDLNGYQITFGGGVTDKALIAEKKDFF